MKELAFLFDHFIFFLIIYVAVILDTVTAVGMAIMEDDKKFIPEKLPNHLYKLVMYTVVLMFANLIEYYGNLTGYDLELKGIIPTSLSILTAEVGSFLKKFKLQYPDL